MKFKKYQSIENHYQTKQIQRFIDNLPDGLNTLCQVTEKLHGTNISFYCEEGEVKVAKRSGFTDTNFYQQEAFIKETIAYLSRNDLVGYVFFGEMVGPGINKGVYYGEAPKFYLFDVRGPNGHYLSCQEVRELNTLIFRIKEVPILYENLPLNDALSLDPVFMSHVAVTDKANLAEGIVIKPMMPRFLPSGQRIIIRKKNPKFEEISRKTKLPVKLLSPDGQLIAESITPYLNANRLANVFSHDDTLHGQHYGKIAGMLVRDALLDYEKDKDVCMRDIDEYKLINKALTRLSIEIVKENR